MIQQRKILVPAILCLMAGTLWFARDPAAASSGATLVPIGAGYEADTLAFFAEQAVLRDLDGTVALRVLPITYASDPFNISPTERAQNLALANSRAAELEAACSTVAVPPTVCEALVVDIQVRSDAEDPVLAGQITPDLDGVFILGGDQTIAMQVTANTLLEDALEAAYLAGVPLGGTSAGTAVQSRYMIAGYIGDNSAWDALKFGAIELWYGDLATAQRGLQFGLDDAVLEQHVLERGRLARLLQAAEQLPGQHVGIGVDWGTGSRLTDGSGLEETTGAYAAVVVDEETYLSAAGAVYTGSLQILSIHDVGLHVLPPGPYTYDLSARIPSMEGSAQTAPSLDGRDSGIGYPAPGAGPLYLAGDLAVDPLGPVTQEFAAAAASSAQPTVVFALGYASDSAALQAASTWANRLGNLGVGNVQTAALTSNADLGAIAAQLASAGAMFLVGNNQQVLAGQIPDMLAAGIDQVLLQRWQAGAPLLFDNAAAAAAGEWMSAEPTPVDYEVEASESFIAGHVSIAPGLAIVPGAVIEPRFLYDYLYGRLVSHGRAHPEAVGVGIERGTAVRITPAEIRVLGEMAVMLVDPRLATFWGVGDNGVIAAAWILLDTYASGETIPGIPAVVGEFSAFLPLVRADD